MGVAGNRQVIELIAGANGESRTPKVLPPPDPKSVKTPDTEYRGLSFQALTLSLETPSDAKRHHDGYKNGYSDAHDSLQPIRHKETGYRSPEHTAFRSVAGQCSVARSPWMASTGSKSTATSTVPSAARSAPRGNHNESQNPRPAQPAYAKPAELARTLLFRLPASGIRALRPR